MDSLTAPHRLVHHGTSPPRPSAASKPAKPTVTATSFIRIQRGTTSAAPTTLAPEISSVEATTASLKREIEEQLRMYLEQDELPLETDSLAWWGGRLTADGAETVAAPTGQRMFPLLAPAARYYFSMQATNGPVERMFSCAKHWVETDRALTGDEVLNKCVVIRAGLEGEFGKDNLVATLVQRLVKAPVVAVDLGDETAV